jgi:hypothetical protein
LARALSLSSSPISNGVTADGIIDHVPADFVCASVALEIRNQKSRQAVHEDAEARRWFPRAGYGVSFE